MAGNLIAIDPVSNKEVRLRANPTTGALYTEVMGGSVGSDDEAYAIGQTPTPEISGGSYLWAAVATNWNGGAASLQFLGPDGVTWLPFSPAAAFTASGVQGIVVGEQATLKVVFTGGPPTGFSSSIS